MFYKEDDLVMERGKSWLTIRKRRGGGVTETKEKRGFQKKYNASERSRMMKTEKCPLC